MTALTLAPEHPTTTGGRIRWGFADGCLRRPTPEGAIPASAAWARAA